MEEQLLMPSHLTIRRLVNDLPDFMLCYKDKDFAVSHDALTKKNEVLKAVTRRHQAYSVQDDKKPREFWNLVTSGANGLVKGATIYIMFHQKETKLLLLDTL